MAVSIQSLQSPLHAIALLLIYAAVAQFEEYGQAGPKNLKTAGQNPRGNG